MLSLEGISSGRYLSYIRNAVNNAEVEYISLNIREKGIS